MKRVLFSGVLLFAPILSAIHLYRLSNEIWLPSLTDSDISTIEVIVVCHIFVCLVSLWVIGELATVLWKAKNRNVLSAVPRFRGLSAVMLGGLAVIGHSQTIEISRVDVSEEAGLPVEIALTPLMASLLLRDILQRRRDQICKRVLPDVFSDEEIALLSRVQRMASDAPLGIDGGELDGSLAVVKELTEAVQRREEPSLRGSGHPLFVVRLYGFPEVKNEQGLRATFRKKRALELLVWLSLNRDRPRRSAARTALWHIDVSDATFSTVVSEMRRGLSELDASLNRAEFLPTTYSDELLLSHRITTDYELLREALDAFRISHSDHQALANQLSEIRDAPFSGTTYEWADLDGTTTRLIIIAMQASQELAEYAKLAGDVELMTIAVSAGLRVMPGNEELLEIQQSFIPQASLSRSMKTG